MSFIENILRSLGIDENLNNLPYRIIILGETAAYFESIRAICSYTPCEIVLSVKKGCISVSGENLYIRKYCAGDVIICGKIQSVVKK